MVNAVAVPQTDALLTSKGLRRTKPRRAILEVLLRCHGAMSHNELCEALATSSLDRATIYRNLIALTEAGVLVRRELGDGLWRVELPRDGSDHAHHLHLACNGCGHLHCPPPSCISLHGEAADHRVLEILLRGLCQSCLPSRTQESDATGMRQ